MHQASDPSDSLGADPNVFTTKAGEGVNAVEVDFGLEEVNFFQRGRTGALHAKTHFLEHLILHE